MGLRKFELVHLVGREVVQISPKYIRSTSKVLTLHEYSLDASSSGIYDPKKDYAGIIIYGSNSDKFPSKIVDDKA